MFEFLKKDVQSRTAEGMLAVLHIAREEIQEKWLSFNDGLTDDKETSLSEKMGLFYASMAKLFDEKYPILLLGDHDVLLPAVARAIYASGTHARNQIDAAIAQFRGVGSGLEL